MARALAPGPSKPTAVTTAPVHVQRKCACGGTPGRTGECAACRRKRLAGSRAALQTKPFVDRPGDRFEREADAIADRVVRGATVDVQPAAVREVGVQRTRGSGVPAPLGIPPVDSVLSSPGRPLDATTRGFMEPRLGHDFSHVRVHADPAADRSARALGALAYTVQNRIVFAAGRYAPGTSQGRRLLAHELTHVLQQDATHAPRLQRKLVVEDPGDPLPGAPPRENWEEVRDAMAPLTSDFEVVSSGRVGPKNAAACASPSRQIDTCLCEMHALPDPPWKIKVDDTAWPHTEEANRRVTIQSTRSGIDLGAWATGGAGGQRAFLDPWRVLEHELCGHAHLMVKGIHPSAPVVRRGSRIMSRPGHDPTVAVENAIAVEVAGAGAAQRGSHTDPHSGESFGRVTIGDFAARDHSVPASATAALDRIEHFMKAESLLKADVVGHTDTTGSDAANRAMGRARARAVRDALVARGIAGPRFNILVGRGEAECTSAGDDPACRKVEVFMYIFERASERFP